MSRAVERRRVEPAKVRAKANALDDGANSGAFKRARAALDLRHPYRRIDRERVAGGLGDMSIDARIDAALDPIGVVEEDPKILFEM
jgi:hypothetical protein